MLSRSVSPLTTTSPALGLLGPVGLAEEVVLPLAVTVELTVTVETCSHFMSSGHCMRHAWKLTLLKTVVIVAVIPQQEHALE